MTKLTTYTVTFRTDGASATEDIDAASPEAALAEARAIADDRDRWFELDFEPYSDYMPVDEIAVDDPDDKRVAEWVSADLLLRFAAADLRDALKNAVTALNTAPCFKVPKLGTDSYAIAAKCGQVLDKARGKQEGEPAHHRTVPSDVPANCLTHEQLTILERLIGEIEYVRETADLPDSMANEPTLTAEARRIFDLPLGAILPDGTRSEWDERLRTAGAIPVYSKTALGQ
jgi:hypothetical protein